jgi:Tol biopolymer transport system component
MMLLAPLGASAASPGDTGRIVFDRFEGDRGAEGSHLGTFIADADGSDERLLAGPLWVAGWSPDGDRLLVGSIHGPAIIDADGSGLQEIGVDTDVSLDCSDWSPDGTTLVCGGSQAGHPEADGVYTVGIDGTGLTRLTTSPYHDTVGTAGECGGGQGRGVYAPDGSQIVFIEQRCGTGPDPSSDETAAIWRIDSDGSDLTQIVPHGQVRSHPGSQLSWSSDGSLVVFGSQEGVLYVVRPDGTGLAEVPLEGGWDGRIARGPEWSPDGTRIAFAMYADSAGTQDLYTVAPDGSGLTRITEAPGAENFVRWAAPAPG